MVNALSIFVLYNYDPFWEIHTPNILEAYKSGGGVRCPVFYRELLVISGRHCQLWAISCRVPKLISVDTTSFCPDWYAIQWLGLLRWICPFFPVLNTLGLTWWRWDREALVWWLDHRNNIILQFLGFSMTYSIWRLPYVLHPSGNLV